MDVLHWFVPWEPSIAVVACCVAAAVIYLRGARRSPLTAPWWRQALFWSGLALTYLCLHTQLDYYAEHEFFVHRLQHLGLHHLGPFLIALSYPGVALRRGLPLSWRVHGVNPLLRWPPVRALLNALFQPAVAVILFVGLIYLWLWPSMHFDAMLDWRLYRAMNWSMAVDGLLFWWLILDPRPRPPARLAPGMRILLPLAAIFPQILVGAWITFAHGDLYPIYNLCGRAFGGITQATDQYLGGLVLWIPSSMMSVLGALIAFRNWLRLSSRGKLAIQQKWKAQRKLQQTPDLVHPPGEFAGRTGHVS